MRKYLESGSSLLCGIIKWWWAFVPSGLLVLFDVLNKFLLPLLHRPRIESMPPWVTAPLIFWIGIAFAIFMTYHELRVQKVALEDKAQQRLPNGFIPLREAGKEACTVYDKNGHAYFLVFGESSETRLENAIIQIWENVPLYGQRDPSTIFKLLTVHEKESGTWDVEQNGIAYLRNGNTKPFNNLCVKKNDLNAFLKKVSRQAKKRQYE